MGFDTAGCLDFRYSRASCSLDFVRKVPVCSSPTSSFVSLSPWTPYSRVALAHLEGSIASEFILLKSYILEASFRNWWL